MKDSLICPHCKKIIQISEVLRKQVSEEINKEVMDKHQKELEEVKKTVSENIKRQFEEKNKLERDDLQKQLAEKEEKLTEFRNAELKLREEKRKLEERGKEMELEVVRKLDEGKKKIEEEAVRKSSEEHRMKDLEKDKKLQDAIKANEELRKKLEQGSQQTQGEVLEMELEKLLKLEFPVDEISEIAKGVRGADILQVVVDKYNRKCGTILWESKNANWSNSWVSKLKDDQRQAKANIAVLVSINLPGEIKNFTFKDGIWITNKSSVLGLAWALRMNLGQLHNLKIANTGKNKKMEDLFTYLTGIEFKQRVDAIVEAFQNMQIDMEREKRWFQSKWSRQEKEIRKIIDNTYGMYGDLQGVTSRSLPEIKILPLKPGKEENETE